MPRILLVAIVLGLPVHAEASDPLDRGSRFNSVDAFIAKLRTFEPSQTSNWLSYQFGAVELGQPEDPNTGTIVVPAKIQSCTVISDNADAAVIFATARPATTATPSEVGMLFSLRQAGQTWRIAACKRFEATGKYASVKCVLTCGADSPPGACPERLVVTIGESQGGRGYSFQTSASYSVSDTITRVDLD
jgi:hypothetical protein